MVLDVEREKTMVQELMDFKEKLDTIIVESFQKNERFQRALQVCINVTMYIPHVGQIWVK